MLRSQATVRAKPQRMTNPNPAMAFSLGHTRRAESRPSLQTCLTADKRSLLPFGAPLVVCRTQVHSGNERMPKRHSKIELTTGCLTRLPPPSLHCRAVSSASKFLGTVRGVLGICYGRFLNFTHPLLWGFRGGIPKPDIRTNTRRRPIVRPFNRTYTSMN